MIAYELRAAYAGTVEQHTGEGDDVVTVEVPAFTGGVITAGDDSLDVRELLDEGNGRITVPESNLQAINALDAYPPLKRVAADDADVTRQGLVNQYADAKVADLRRDPRLADVAGVSSANKPELIVALEELDRRQAEGALAAPLEGDVTVDALGAAAAARTDPPAPAEES